MGGIVYEQKKSVCSTTYSGGYFVFCHSDCISLHRYEQWIYYEQDGFVVTLGNWLNGRLPISNIETLECHLVIPDKE